jgi:hypothetical protein
MVYFLSCWTFVPAIIGVVEGIVLLTMTDEQFEWRYCPERPCPP